MKQANNMAVNYMYQNHVPYSKIQSYGYPFSQHYNATMNTPPGYNYSNWHHTLHCINRSKLNLMNNIRMLWEQHAAWTRMAISSIVFGTPDESFVVNRLLRNPIDFEIILGPFYGDVIAAEFKNLLTDHLTIAAELVKAAKAGDKLKADNAEKRWYANADEIATLLGNINPYWSKKDWQKMLYQHLGFVKTEATDLLAKDYPASIQTYDKLETQILKMADIMSEGIIRQFPSHFL